MKTGKAAVFEGVGKALAVREYPVPEPSEGHAVLSLIASGICGTDIHIIDGRLPIPPPMIPGHEFIGQIESLGTGVSKDGLGELVNVGDRVVACVALACGSCLNCRQDETASCMSFGVTNAADPDVAPHFHGGYADYLHQPAKTLVKIPEGVDPVSAASFPCAGPTVIRACTYGGGLEKDELVVVQGLGPVGMFGVAWAVAQGCRVVAVGSGRSPERMRMALELGAMEVFDYHAISTDEIQKRVMALASRFERGDGADVVLEASGAPSAIPAGMTWLRTRGRYFIPGQYSLSGEVSIHPEMITFKALRLIGSGQYTLSDIAVYLDFLKQHPSASAQFAACVSGRFPVSAANEAIESVRQGRGIKNVFVKP